MKGILVFLVISILLAAFIGPIASSLPDGLEKVAQTLGFERRALDTPVVASPLPDYSAPGISHPYVSTSIAGVIGTLICFLAPFTVYLFRKK